MFIHQIQASKSQISKSLCRLCEAILLKNRSNAAFCVVNTHLSYFSSLKTVPALLVRYTYVFPCTSMTISYPNVMTARQLSAQPPKPRQESDHTFINAVKMITLFCSIFRLYGSVLRAALTPVAYCAYFLLVRPRQNLQSGSTRCHTSS